MALLAIFDNDVEITARNGSLVLLRKGVAFQTIPPHEVEEVHLHGGAELTTAGRNFLLARGIDVVFLTLDGRTRGRLVGEESAWAARRLAQYRLITDDSRRIVLARAFVRGKLLNQHSLLRARQRYLRRDEIAEALLMLKGLAIAVHDAASLDALRGVEGMGAQLYFGSFASVITNGAFAWTGRNRRPPRDPVNAALSFGYTMLCNRMEHAVRRAGLDPYLGVLHESIRGAPALALDLAEEFRPVVDGLVLNLVNRGQLGPEDFEPPSPEAMEAAFPEGVPESLAGAVYLSDVGRKILTRAWALRLADRSPHPTLGADWSLAGLISEQALQLKRVFEGEAAEYHPAKV